MQTPPTTHDEYLANLPQNQRAALQSLRQTIKAIAPLAEECISYQICAFRQKGMLVGYGATEKHCALFLMSNSTVAAHADDLQGYDTSTGTVRFQPEQPLPVALVKKLVEARLAEKAAGASYGSAKKTKAGATADTKSVKKSPSAKQKGVKSAASKSANKKAAGKKPAGKKAASPTKTKLTPASKSKRAKSPKST
ncbi:MAG: DUF1801 domain-containing protein [Planctomycetota bacterium]|nr:DUF1801 domain-containing protein [Planctomycetota bacterium]